MRTRHIFVDYVIVCKEEGGEKPPIFVPCNKEALIYIIPRTAISNS